MVTGVDVHARGESLKKRLVNFCRDADQLRFASESFDAAISTFALEHCVNPKQRLHEIRRVVRPGGRIDRARRTIAAAGQELVLKAHTYDRRVGTFLELIEERKTGAGRRRAAGPKSACAWRTWNISRSMEHWHAPWRNCRRSRSVVWQKRWQDPL
jgi:SAM-dependent methyltransferase